MFKRKQYFHMQSIKELKRVNHDEYYEYTRISAGLGLLTEAIEHFNSELDHPCLSLGVVKTWNKDEAYFYLIGRRKDINIFITGLLASPFADAFSLEQSSKLFAEH